MGSGVARQCSRNSCLTGWAIWIPNRGPPRPSRSSELEEGPGHGPDPRFLCPTASGRARGEVRKDQDQTPGPGRRSSG
jgi:hypothetical protein